MNPLLLHSLLSEQTAEQVVQQLVEMSSRPGEVFHFTKAQYALKIIRNDSFQLSMVVGDDSVPFQPDGKYFYLSTTRQFSNQFGRESAVRLNLDGRLLSSKFKSVPVDYWYNLHQRSGMASKLHKRKSPKSFEAEERFYSREAVVKNARRFILSVDLCWGMPNSQAELDLMQTLAEECTEKSIPVTVYDGVKSFLTKRNGTPWLEHPLSGYTSSEEVEEDEDMPSVWRDATPLSPNQFLSHLLLLTLLGVKPEQFAQVFLDDEKNKALHSYQIQRRDESYSEWVEDQLQDALRTLKLRLQVFKGLDNKIDQPLLTRKIEELLGDVKYSSRLYQETLSSALENLLSKQLRKHQVNSHDPVGFLASRVLTV